MTAARADLAGLPDWPRGLSREQAAAYIGVSVVLFDREIANIVPCFNVGARKLWDRRALDRWLDGRNPANDHPSKEKTLEAFREGLSRGRRQ